MAENKTTIAEDHPDRLETGQLWKCARIAVELLQRNGLGRYIP